jgi:hypothetical protein
MWCKRLTTPQRRAMDSVPRMTRERRVSKAMTLGLSRCSIRCPCVPRGNLGRLDLEEGRQRIQRLKALHPHSHPAWRALKTGVQCQVGHHYRENPGEIGEGLKGHHGPARPVQPMISTALAIGRPERALWPAATAMELPA